jgi:2'-hydroxyisoflavone reductase
MRVLVIGGIRFMGREIVRKLLARGHEITVLHRSGSHDLGPSVRDLQADRGDLPTIQHLLQRGAYEVVFDLAYDWEKGTTAEQVEATARAASGPALKRYVFMSSVAAYGPGADWHEDDRLAPDDFPNPYIRHKATAERALFRMHAERGFPVTTFRPPFVHGPGQPFYREQFFWDRLLDGRPIILPDDGETLMQWAYVEDVAEACVRAIEMPEASGQGFNVAYPPISQSDFVEALARTAGVTARLVPVPRERILAAGGQLFGKNLYFGEALDMPSITSVVEKVHRVLGVEISDFGEALRANFEWYLAQPRLPVDYSLEDRLLAEPLPRQP